MELQKIAYSVWTEFVRVWTGNGGGLCEHGNEPLGYKKDLEFLD
jgi:hypothetical protein